MPEASAARRVPAGLLVALAAGALVRAVQLWWASGNVPDFAAPALDAGFHHYWASLIVDASTRLPAWMDDPELATTPYYRPPGYVWWLALQLAVGGGSLVFAKVGQLVIGLVGIVLVFQLAKHLADERAATIGALGVALSPALIYFEGELVAAAPSAVLVTGWVLLALRLSSGSSPAGALGRSSSSGSLPTVKQALGLGALLGFGCLLRPNLVVLALPLLVAWWSGGRWSGARDTERRDTEQRDADGAGGDASGAPDRAALVRVTVALLVGIVVVTAPVTVRNAVVGGEAVWISMNGPITARYGNHDDASGHHVRLPKAGVLAGLTEVSASGYPGVRRHVAKTLGRPVVGAGEPDKPGALTWGDLSSILRKESTDWAMAKPGAFLALSGRKSLLLLGPSEVSNNKQVQLIIEHSPVLRWLPGRWWLLAPLAFVGAASLWRRQRRRSLWLTVGSTSILLAAVVPFLAAARFRVPVLGLVAALAGVGLVALFDLRAAGRQAKSEGRGLPLAVAGAAGLLLFAVNWTGYTPDVSRWHLDRATAYLRAKNDVAARVELDAAIHADARSADAYRSRGLLAARAGDARQALADLEQAVALGGGPPAEAALATLKTQQGKVDATTLGQFETLLRQEPKRVDVLYNYALALSTQGRLADAKQTYERLFAVDPSHADARNNYGRVLLQLGDPRGAIAQFDQALKTQPDHTEAAYNRAVAYARVDPAVAEQAYRALLAKEPAYGSVRLNLGALLLDGGRPADAKAVLEPAAAEVSASPGLLFNYARAAWMTGDEAGGLSALRRARTERQRSPVAPGPGSPAIDLLLAEWLITARSPSLRAPLEAVKLTSAVVEGAAWGHPIPIRAHASALDAAGRAADAAAARARAEKLCADAPQAFGGACAQ